MNIILDEDKLMVNSYECHDATITKTPEGYKAELFDIKDYTIRKTVKDKYGNDKLKILRPTMIIKSKIFEYSGIELEDVGVGTVRHLGYMQYLHKVNKNGNYINYYE